MISQELLEELAIILKEDFALVLSLKEVSDIGTSLVGVFELLAQIESEKENIQA